MKMIRKILSGIIIAVTLVLAGGGVANADSNLPDIGEYGAWATDSNRELFLTDITADAQSFSGANTPISGSGFVPLEAKIGLAFMDAFSHIAHILELSLVRFTMIFIIMMYLLWMMLEAHNIIIGKAKTNESLKSILKKGAIVGAWVAVLSIGPAETFMLVMSPILSVSSYTSDLILNAVTQTVGVSLPDTCGAIHQYASANIASHNLLSADAAANIMCVPTRMSGFAYAAIQAGWRWIIAGFGNSAFAITCGLATIIGFIYLAWKFAFVAFGVIADLFLGIMMLPFTAIAETVGKTSYKGIAGEIFNGFVKLFSPENLQSQIMRFINAALHFVVLSIIIAICAALLSGITIFNSNGLPDFNSPGIWVTVLTMALTWYLASHASQIADEIGGKIDTSFGDKIKSDIQTVWKDTKATTKSWYKAIKEEINK